MNAPPPIENRAADLAPTVQSPARAAAAPAAREMSPAECDAQRRLVRASLFAKPL